MRVLVLLLLCTWRATCQIPDSLYDWEEPITQLHADNFTDTIWHSDTAWVVEFYSTWCGHCQRFAPFYSEFAEQVKGWLAVVRVAAVSCSNEENNDLCRNYEIWAYPTLRFFPPRCIERNTGQTYDGLKVPIEHLRHATIDYVESINLEEIYDPPDVWPILEPFETLDDLAHEFADVNYTIAIVEGPQSDPYLGKELIIELMNATHIASGRISHHGDLPLVVTNVTDYETAHHGLPVSNDVRVFRVSEDEERTLTIIPAEIADDVTSRIHLGNITAYAENTTSTDQSSTDLCFAEGGRLELDQIPESLYDWEEPITQLHADNFTDTIWHSDTAWVVDFYSTLCDDSQRFAPFYSEFAEQVKGWRAVVRVAAISCSNEENNDLCRNYGILTYPTLRFFPPRCVERNLGQTYDGLKVPIEHLRHAAIDYVESINLEEIYDDVWPILEPFETLDDLAHEFADVNYTIAIVEGPQSDPYLGKELIIELMNATHIAAGRVPHYGDFSLMVTNVTDYETAHHGLPVSDDVRVFRVSEDEERTLTVIPAEIADDVTSRIHRGNITTYAENTPSTDHHGSNDLEELRSAETWLAEGWRPPVYMQDLESALYYVLYSEIGSKPYLMSRRLLALQQFMDVLSMYFPGRDHVMRFLNQVNRQLQMHDYTKPIRGSDWVAWLVRCNGQDGSLSDEIIWVGCEGSEPHLRGFPCALWTTFHALTVNAYIMNENSTTFQPEEVLLPIRDFVKYYFSCRECARNFVSGTDDLANVLTLREDMVLWLWRKHNRANYHLRDDITEDPLAPKEIFPSDEMCPSCRHANYSVCSETCTPQDNLFYDWSLWDLEPVLVFLVDMYRPENLVLDDDVADEVSVESSRRKRQACTPHPQATDWSPCSVTCGVGTSDRRTNQNDHCRLTTETKLCKLRDCGMAVVPADDTCQPTVLPTQPSAFIYQNCESVMENQWRYCNRCAGQVCRPASRKDFNMMFNCGGRTALFKVDWIITCTCDIV